VNATLFGSVKKIIFEKGKTKATLSVKAILVNKLWRLK